MVYINKVYTKSGDQGLTGLGDGSRVHKTHPRIAAIGSVDELNAAVGLAACHCVGDLAPVLQNFSKEIVAIQHDLFDLGADLCTPLCEEDKLRIDDGYVLRLERAIDFYTEQMEPLRSFVLPGGSIASAHLHMARTVCRRAERDVLTLGERTTINPFVSIYLNRLSDYLFVAARMWNHGGRTDVLWTPGVNRPEQKGETNE